MRNAADGVPGGVCGAGAPERATVWHHDTKGRFSTFHSTVELAERGQSRGWLWWFSPRVYDSSAGAPHPESTNSWIPLRWRGAVSCSRMCSWVSAEGSP